jgi:Putative viral replication protein./RNA helicase.
MSQQYSNWCFTVNNHTVLDDQLLQDMPYSYLLYGHEVGQEGTPHLQGYVQFQKKLRLSALKKLHPTAHWEPAKGSSTDNYEYCTKEGDYQEFGTLKNTKGAAQKGVNSMAQRIKRNQRLLTVPFEELIASGDIHPCQIRGLKNAINDIKEQNNRLHPPDSLDGDLPHLWYWGEAGTGKSLKARTDHPDAYLKAANKWWDGYDNEDVVLIEDFDKNHSVLCHHLKLWADRVCFQR